MFFTVLLAGIFIGASLVQAAYEEFLFIEGSLCREVDDIAELPRILDQACHTGKLTGKEVVTEMPEELIWQYTRCGTIPVKDYLVDDTFGGQGSHYKYSRKDVKAIEDKWHHMFLNLDACTRCLRTSTTEFGPFRTGTFKKKTVMVFGSTSPDVETLLLLLGAKDVITVDYNQLTFEDRRLKTMAAGGAEVSDRSGYGAAGGRRSFFLQLRSRRSRAIRRSPLPRWRLAAMDIIKQVLSSDSTLFSPCRSALTQSPESHAVRCLRLPLLLDGWETTKQYGGDIEVG